MTGATSGDRSRRVTVSAWGSEERTPPTAEEYAELAHEVLQLGSLGGRRRARHPQLRDPGGAPARRRPRAGRPRRLVQPLDQHQARAGQPLPGAPHGGHAGLGRDVRPPVAVHPRLHRDAPRRALPPSGRRGRARRGTASRLDQYGMPDRAHGHHRLLARRHRHPRRALRHPASPRHRRTSTPGAPVHGWELADAAAAQGIEPRAGDAVLIRSGHGPYFAATGEPSRASAGSAGVHASCIEFLARHRGVDAGVGHAGRAERRPGHPEPTRPAGAAPRASHPASRTWACRSSTTPTSRRSPVACADAGRGSSSSSSRPLVIPRGTGSPVNPLAIL